MHSGHPRDHYDLVAAHFVHHQVIVVVKMREKTKKTLVIRSMYPAVGVSCEVAASQPAFPKA